MYPKKEASQAASEAGHSPASSSSPCHWDVNGPSRSSRPASGFRRCRRREACDRQAGFSFGTVEDRVHPCSPLSHRTCPPEATLPSTEQHQLQKPHIVAVSCLAASAIADARAPLARDPYFPLMTRGFSTNVGGHLPDRKWYPSAEILAPNAFRAPLGATTSHILDRTIPMIVTSTPVDGDGALGSVAVPAESTVLPPEV